ncbi:acyltransferase [Acinetobacter baumannii]|uniref:acyltransferase family protein n=1 Tax=Acinetobacter baumannii TaxID=470 RepID=UPI00244D5962|nr:acyltransferase [Acinetobacter baumannii]MDH2620875.1 acyltransferase [Acinetobacter baumannii]
MSKINSAESIRGLACLAVVFSHLVFTFYPYAHEFESNLPIIDFFNSLYNSPFGFLYSGNAAVYIFFVLSGFVLSYAILGRNKDINKKIISMSVKRYPRLAIPAIISVLISYFIFQIDVDASNASSWFGNVGTYEGSFLYAIYDGAINAFIFGKSEYNWVLWTMQIELFGSFLVFLLCYLNQTSKLLVLLTSLVFIILGFLVSLKMGFGFFSFVAGMLFYLYGKKINAFIAVPMLLVGLYFAGAHNFSYSYSVIAMILGTKTAILLNVLCAPLVVYSILMNDKLSSLLDNKVFVYLGKLSFSMYLLHMLIIYIIGIPIFNYFYELGFLFSSLIASITVILFTVIASIPYSNFVDALSINVANKIESRIFNKQRKEKFINENA